MAESIENCPDEDQFSSYIDGSALPAETHEFEAHVGDCHACRMLLSDYAKSLEVFQGALQPGERTGRYQIESMLGAGAMGTVYVARDTELDRLVALKFIRTDFLEKAVKQHGLALPSLRDEAQSLAQLSHPNIVNVYELGVYEGQSFVAMEYVEGETLLQWSTKKRLWKERLEILVQAGQGLVAAHSAKIVHRDIKPGNILIGRDGRVRILDFGLARYQPSAFGHSSTPSTITSIGGTSAYMAPEQSKMPADFLSDQYSFCVTAHEVLLGARPDEKSPTMKIPSRLLAIVRKGLKADRNKRFSGMEELLAELRTQLRPGRRWKIAAVLVGVAVLLAVVWKTAFSAGENKEAQILCSGEERFAGVWNDDRARTLVSHWTRENASPALSSTLVSALGNYRLEWLSQYQEACMDSTVRRIQSEEVWDKRMLCLDQRRSYAIEVLAVVEALSGGELHKGVPMVKGLPSPSHCGNLRYLSDTVDMPSAPAIRSKIATLTSQLVGIEVRGTTSDQDLQIANNVFHSASELGYPPILAHARGLAGIIEFNRSGSIPAVKKTLHLALADAERGGDAQHKYKAAMYLSVFEKTLEKHSEASLWLDYAEASLSRGGLLAGVESARIAHHRGTLSQAKGEIEKARDWGKLALSHLRGGKSLMAQVELANVYSFLGIVSRKLGEYKAAKEYYEQSLLIVEKLYGKKHELTSSTHQRLAVLATIQGDLSAARERFLEVLTISEREYGASHREVANARMSLGAVYMQLGDYDDADRELRDAEKVFEELEGTERMRAQAIGNRAALALYRENFSDALAHATKSLSILEKLLGTDHPVLAVGLLNVGIAQKELGNLKAASIALHRAIALQEKALGVSNPTIANTLSNLGLIQLEQKRWKSVAKTMKRSIALKSPNAVSVAIAYLGLAKALWHLNRKDTEVESSLVSAKQKLAGVEVEHQELLEEIESWLTKVAGKP